MNTLAFEKIVGETRKDRNFPVKYLNELYGYNMDIMLPVKSVGPLSSIKCFYPLPSRLLLNEQYTGPHKIIKNKNEYQFHGINGHRIVFSDKKLPFVAEKLKYPIPFSFPVPSETEVEIISSNVYYYEVTLLDIQNQESWDGECVSIGFGNKNTTFLSHVGWYDGSVGFHSDDGTIRFNEADNSVKAYTNVWGPGDVAGAGIIYVGKNEFKPFFTFNGKLVYMAGKTIQMKFPYFPMVGYDHSRSIELNFSSKPFKYDIKKLILKNSENVISSENTFIIDYDIGHILNEPPIIESSTSTKPKFSILNITDASGKTTGIKLVPIFPEISGLGIKSLNSINPINLANLNDDNIEIEHDTLNPIGPTGQIPITNDDFSYLTGSLNGPNEPSISIPSNKKPGGLMSLLAYGNNPLSNSLDSNGKYTIFNLNTEINLTNSIQPEPVFLQVPNNTLSNNLIWNNLVVEGQSLFNFANINVQPINSLTGNIQVNENSFSTDSQENPNENNLGPDSTTDY